MRDRHRESERGPADEVPAIRTSGLTKRYRPDVLAVDDLDLTVEQGEVFGFLGPNGAGKSTTIDVVMDYVRPTVGSVAVLGFDATATDRPVGGYSKGMTRARAMTLAVTAYLGLTLLWDLVPNGVHLLVTGEMPGQVVPAWLVLIQGVSPTGAYNALTQTLLLGGTVLEARIGGPAPAYLHPGVFLAIMLAWTVLPLVIGYLGFRRTDLS